MMIGRGVSTFLQRECLHNYRNITQQTARRCSSSGKGITVENIKFVSVISSLFAVGAGLGGHGAYELIRKAGCEDPKIRGFAVGIGIVEGAIAFPLGQIPGLVGLIAFNVLMKLWPEPQGQEPRPEKQKVEEEIERLK